ncbi:hypothetical protein SNE510_75230 [Streptomyces sp. NE5-10]|uniref:hypothetical protein n=1 Tax=Streptomyces sp. NE5-10 TaxID=2759674 RepID=UPI00190810F8|nr:hypothetical protein [Streptomyces sp. NE5-10]GHJ98004.1 hypothetical protein SNE510_75230 [Streptomyces sp. NE5-10]
MLVALRLPVSGVALLVLVFGDAETIPVVILAAVTSFVIAGLPSRAPWARSAARARRRGRAG